jgi:hypothetical protein
MTKEIVYTKTKREILCQFNKLAINTTWSICFKNHHQDGDFIGNYRIRRFPTVGSDRMPESDGIRLSEKVGNQRISPVSDYRHPVGKRRIFSGSDRILWDSFDLGLLTLV